MTIDNKYSLMDRVILVTSLDSDVWTVIGISVMLNGIVYSLAQGTDSCSCCAEELAMAPAPTAIGYKAK